jgi:flagellin
MSAVGSILTNQGALDALQSISSTSAENNTLENELSTGLAINSPADNPAGYITAQGFTSQLNGLTQAVSNANEGVSLLQTAQGAVQQQIGVVQQLNSIAVQAANGTQTSQESTSLQSVFSQLVSQVSSISSQTQFNNVNLLDGTFTNKQFQVGANEGQTLNLSIGNTSATNIGLYSTGVAAATYSTGANAGSGVVGAGVFTAGAVKIVGPQGGSGSTAALLATTSAASAAKDVNAISGKTGVAAAATNTATFSATLGTGGLVFSLQASTGSGGAGSKIGGAVAVDASSIGEAVSQINQQTGSTGIVASSASGKLSLTQETGQNIKFTVGAAAASGSLKTTKGAGTTVATGNILQGQVQLESSAAFTVGGVGSIAATGPSLESLANVNVSTTAGANQAINVVKYALQSLNNTGGQLGAEQQGLTANINNLNTTSENVTSALGVVQDANLPQVANQLTQAQIQAQAGVAALKSSTTLQQSYLSLLP